MSGRAWTPGPWRERGYKNGEGGIWIDGGFVRGRTAGTVATVLPIKAQTANARLISAAPDLFEALASIIAANDEFRRALPADWQSDPVNDACDAARAALAKAEGNHG